MHEQNFTLVTDCHHILTSALLAHAQSYTYRDQSGLPQGSAQWNQYGQRWEYRDRSGLPTGSAQYNQYNGSWQLRDQSGLPQGTIQRNGYGNYGCAITDGNNRRMKQHVEHHQYNNADRAGRSSNRAIPDWNPNNYRGGGGGTGGDRNRGQAAWKWLTKWS
jgi:hypothetical protein